MTPSSGWCCLLCDWAFCHFALASDQKWNFPLLITVRVKAQKCKNLQRFRSQSKIVSYFEVFYTSMPSFDSRQEKKWVRRLCDITWVPSGNQLRTLWLGGMHTDLQNGPGRNSWTVRYACPGSPSALLSTSTSTTPGPWLCFMPLL